jgi:hypothetical protein
MGRSTATRRRKRDRAGSRRGSSRTGATAKRLTIKQILAWADAHHAKMGTWPKQRSGSVIGGEGDTWLAIDSGSRFGHRGLPGGSSLAKLLARHRNVPCLSTRPKLSVEHVLEWADSHHRRTGAWPNAKSGPVPEAPGETWGKIEAALRNGSRSAGHSRPRPRFRLSLRRRGRTFRLATCRYARGMHRPILVSLPLSAWGEPPDWAHRDTWPGIWPGTNCRAGHENHAEAQRQWQTISRPGHPQPVLSLPGATSPCAGDAHRPKLVSA